MKTLFGVTSTLLPNVTPIPREVFIRQYRPSSEQQRNTEQSFRNAVREAHYTLERFYVRGGAQ